ncbi:hypothetical protein EZS27_040384 [termite gut metagenome]|uniref:Uncharacterized protein n=1 Tax=termite gut metagenome TaxID=433724 RepID=A0A5J4PHK5_9ZZZZ
MKKFIFKISLPVGLFLSISISILWFLPYNNPDNYYLAYNKKCDLLRQGTSNLRIIFVGGSNLAFGIDSKMITDSLHIDVINYGLSAGIGLKYMIDDVCIYAKKMILLFLLLNIGIFGGN